MITKLNPSVNQLLIVGLGYYFYNKSKHSSERYLIAFGEKRNDSKGNGPITKCAFVTDYTNTQRIREIKSSCLFNSKKAKGKDLWNYRRWEKAIK